MEQLGRMLTLLGAVVVLVGLLVTFSDRLPFRIGRLPLDFHYQRDNFSLYFPLGTSILISAVLTAVLMLVGRR